MPVAVDGLACLHQVLFASLAQFEELLEPDAGFDLLPVDEPRDLAYNVGAAQMIVHTP